MKCLNCGTINGHYLCDSCIDADVLDKIFEQIRFYKPETCENPYLAELATGLTEKYAERDIIPEILGQFDSNVSEYYYCQYYRMRRDSRFEDTAINYIQHHELEDVHTQIVMYDLIESYIPNNFIKPNKWCKLVMEREDFGCELYVIAAKYFGMIGEYDLSDAAVDKAMEICKQPEPGRILIYSPESIVARLERQKVDTQRYRTKKPYWPTTEERRCAVAQFYDKKGIKYPRIKSKPVKIKESEFEPIKECFEDELSDYCAFWCSEAFSISAIKCIYQIGAVKVSNNEIIDTFEMFIRPWDGGASTRKASAKEAGASLEVIESAEDVDFVMPKFFNFVGDDVLVSTGALGNQAKLISRAARYAGMKEIKNEFFDILDLAADASADFDFANNTREYLLDHFSIDEGKTALEKAKINKKLYDELVSYGN